MSVGKKLRSSGALKCGTDCFLGWDFLTEHHHLTLACSRPKPEACTVGRSQAKQKEIMYMYIPIIYIWHTNAYNFVCKCSFKKLCDYVSSLHFKWALSSGDGKPQSCTKKQRSRYYHQALWSARSLAFWWSDCYVLLGCLKAISCDTPWYRLHVTS